MNMRRTLPAKQSGSKTLRNSGSHRAAHGLRTAGVRNFVTLSMVTVRVVSEAFTIPHRFGRAAHLR